MLNRDNLMSAQRNLILNWIRKLQSDDDETVQQAQMCLLAGGTLVVDVLIAEARQGDEPQQLKLLTVLNEIDDPRCFDYLSEMVTSVNIMIGDMAARGLVRYGRKSVDVLLNYLPHSQYFVQISIVIALQKIGDVRAVSPLMAFLEKARSPVQRYTIIQALGVLGDPQAADLIRTFQNDSDHHVRDRVQTALELLEKKRITGS
jgi:HEAT repeat protein